MGEGPGVGTCGIKTYRWWRQKKRGSDHGGKQWCLESGCEEAHCLSTNMMPTELHTDVASLVVSPLQPHSHGIHYTPPAQASRPHAPNKCWQIFHFILTTDAIANNPPKILKPLERIKVIVHGVTQNNTTFVLSFTGQHLYLVSMNGSNIAVDQAWLEMQQEEAIQASKMRRPAGASATMLQPPPPNGTAKRKRDDAQHEIPSKRPAPLYPPPSSGGFQQQQQQGGARTPPSQISPSFPSPGGLLSQLHLGT
jgi:hypothetical protein